MPLLATCLIVAACAHAPIGARHPDTTPLYQCDFETESDSNYDAWPDGWKRRRGPGYPHYLTVRIGQEPSAVGKACLRMELDGAAAAAFSPPVDVDPQHDYVLEAFVKTEGLVHDEACFFIEFQDEDYQPLERQYGPRAQGTTDWTKLRLGPVTCGKPGVRRAVVGLQIGPADDSHSADLTGAAAFDDIWFGQAPRMTLTISPEQLLYSSGEPVQVECRISGHREENPRVTLELEDALGRRLTQFELPLKSHLEKRRSSDSASDADDPMAQTETDSRPRDASATWMAPVNEPGFYRIRAKLLGGEGVVHIRERTLVVIDPLLRVSQSEFGWTLSEGEGDLQLQTLAAVLAQSGVGWIKFPLWYDDRDQARVEALTWFADRLSSEGIGLVGLLMEPPPETRLNLGLSTATGAANLFVQNPELWYPSLEPVMARMSLKVRSWQLGRDEDTSFVGLRDLQGTIALVKQHLDRIGQDVHVGIGWGWQDQELPSDRPPWSFLSRSSTPPLSATELGAYLSDRERMHSASWVSLDLLDPDRYDLETRASDLVQRMVAAKEHGARAIYCSAPLDPRRGMITQDAIGELFLPWRTTALTLAGAGYMGQLTLPDGIETRVFSRGSETMIVAWSAAPRETTLYLGENVRQTDVWGRSVKPPREPGGQVLSLGPTPTFITGVHEAIGRWRMTLALSHDRLPDATGGPQPLSFTVKNGFGQPVGGKARLILPADWKAMPETFDIKLAADEELIQPFELILPTNAGSGRQTIRIDFELMTDREYTFSVYRFLEVGLNDVFLEAISHLNEAGDLEVEQRLVNRTDQPVTFRCYLSAPDRRRLRKQVLKLPTGEDVQNYRLRNGQSLVGRPLAIRAEEIGGDRRILNLTILAEP